MNVIEIGKSIPVNTAITQSGVVIDYSYEIAFDGLGNVDLVFSEGGGCYIPRMTMAITPTAHRNDREEIVEFIRQLSFRPGENSSANEDAAIEAKQLNSQFADIVNNRFISGKPVFETVTGPYYMAIRQVVRSSYVSVAAATAERSVQDGCETAASL